MPLPCTTVRLWPSAVDTWIEPRQVSAQDLCRDGNHQLARSGPYLSDLNLLENMKPQPLLWLCVSWLQSELEIAPLMFLRRFGMPERPMYCRSPGRQTDRMWCPIFQLPEHRTNYQINNNINYSYRLYLLISECMQHRFHVIWFTAKAKILKWSIIWHYHKSMVM